MARDADDRKNLCVEPNGTFYGDREWCAVGAGVDISIDLVGRKPEDYELSMSTSKATVDYEQIRTETSGVCHWKATPAPVKVKKLCQVSALPYLVTQLQRLGYSVVVDHMAIDAYQDLDPDDQLDNWDLRLPETSA